eukprot:10448729-Alexandrium_andersonii.AAC.1
MVMQELQRTSFAAHNASAHPVSTGNGDAGVAEDESRCAQRVCDPISIGSGDAGAAEDEFRCAHRVCTS